jgi:hypothetical protein
MLALYSTKVGTPSKPKPWMKAHYYNLCSLAHNKDLWWKKRQPQNAMGSKQMPSIKKEATPKCKGLKTKTLDEKETTPKCKGLKTKTFDKKAVALKYKRLKTKTFNKKRGNPRT